jgi:multidrug efflux pump subunit AcrB
MENLVSKQIEKQVKNLTGVKKVTSNSFQDYSVVIVEFNTDVKVDKAKRDVKDAVDKAKKDLPKNLPNEPEVKDIDLSELPILYVNLSGNYDLNKLKKYADKIKDKIEALKEIKRVDLVGALEREIQINVDLYKMQAAGIGFDDIERGVAAENLSATPGQVSMNNQKRILSIKNEFKSVDQIQQIIIKNAFGKAVYLRDIAEIKDAFQEQKSYARLYGKNVITLNIIKASGQNLINASDKINALLEDMQTQELPNDLSVVVTGDQSETTRNTLHDLINTIIIGFILVTVILMFFMGVSNALFVAMSVPLSCAIAFLVMPTIGFTLNMIVLFSFLLALGIVVDDAIVVIENTHRIFDNGKMPIKKAAKLATGEVFLPVLSGTLTTLIPFIPLAFWSGVIGQFMFYLPITLIITLLASLFVAYIINPVFAVDFMKPHNPNDTGVRVFTKKDKIIMIIAATIILLSYITRSWSFGNFILLLYGFVLLEKFVLEKWIHTFQNKTWPAFQDWYTRILNRSLNHPFKVLGIAFVICIFSIVIVGIRKPNVVFFPSGQPNFTYVYLNMPVGTDQAYTNEVLKTIETKVYKALDMDPAHNKFNPMVKSIISNVTVGAVDPNSGEVGEFPNKGKVTVAYVPFAEREGGNTNDCLMKIREAVKGIPGAEITVDKEQGGPPLPKPIVIEISGDNLDSLVRTADRLKRELKLKQIPGVEELRSDFQSSNPEIVFDLDRQRMNAEGMNTYQVAMGLRTAVFGKEVSRYRDANEDYPITLRLAKDQRDNIDAVRNMPITFRDMATGIVRTIPISSFATIDYATTYGGIKRKNQKRIISLSSNVLTGYNENEVVASVAEAIKDFNAPSGVQLKMGGQQEEQAETMGFLGNAMFIAVALIFLILVMQFNSFSRTIIIMTEIIFSVFGVMLGCGLFKTDISIVMSGIGIVALAGIVVRNGILLVEFMDSKLHEGMDPRAAILEAGRTRMTPVLLTATAAILGLIPLAVGMNIDFSTLLSEWNPHIYFGGDSVAFWGPLAWTMIYGLSFATFLTLILVPVMCLLSFQFKDWVKAKKAQVSNFVK